MVKYYFLSFLLASIWSCIGYGQTFKVQNFDHKTEIGTNIINTLAEDENGYIWIGTEGLGIARYNGTSFQYYNNVLVKDGLHVKSISFDTDKNIYIGSYNTGFFHSHIDSLANVRLHPDSKSPSVYYVEKKEDRTIIAGLDILTLYSGGQIINQITFEKGDAPKIYNTLKLPSFTILLTNRGNFVVDAYEITPLDQWLGTEKELANNCIHAFHENNKITLLTKDGKRSVNVFLNDEQAKFFYIDTLKQTTPFLPNEFITYSDRSQQYSYFITNLGRVFKSDGHVSALLKSNFKESIRVPTGIIVDRNENLWVSSRIQGLFKFSKCAFTPVNFNKDLKEPDIIFYHEFNDSVIVFTRDNDQSTLIGFQNQESPFTSYPFRVYSHSQQNSTHFFGTTHGVYKYENAKLVNAIPALKNKMCFISKKNEEEFFIYEKEKGLYTFHLKKGLNYLKNQPEENIDFLYTGSKVPGENSYFFGGIGCTQLLKNEKWYNLTPSFKNKGAANTYVHSIPDDKRKILWLMSPSSLVGYHPNGELQIIDKLSWIKSTVVYDAILDEAGNLILGTANGIVYLELNEKGFPVYSTLYGNREGYEVYEVNYNTITHVGEGLYRFATLEGVYTLDVKELPLYHTPKAPIVDQIRIANQQIKYGGKGTYITLKDNEEVLIQYNVINPQSSVVYYSYRINDKNNGTWSVWSRENSSLISSALGPGIYQLEIRASFNKKPVVRLATLNW